MHAGLLTLKQEVMPSRLNVRQVALQKDFRYLWVQAQNQEALLVWVGTESSPQGNVSVWVSADGVVVRLLNGRLIGISEPRRSWQLIRETQSPEGQNPGSYPIRLIQTSDQQPGFQIGIERPVHQVMLAVAPDVLSWFAGTPDVRWIEEKDHMTGKQTAIFALSSNEQTVAGQRCIASDWCVRWQTWPPSLQPAAP